MGGGLGSAPPSRITSWKEDEDGQGPGMSRWPSRLVSMAEEEEEEVGAACSCGPEGWVRMGGPRGSGSQRLRQQSEEGKRSSDTFTDPREHRTGAGGATDLLLLVRDRGGGSPSWRRTNRTASEFKPSQSPPGGFPLVLFAKTSWRGGRGWNEWRDESGGRFTQPSHDQDTTGGTR